MFPLNKSVFACRPAYFNPPRRHFRPGLPLCPPLSPSVPLSLSPLPIPLPSPVPPLFGVHPPIRYQACSTLDPFGPGGRHPGGRGVRRGQTRTVGGEHAHQGPDARTSLRRLPNMSSGTGATAQREEPCFSQAGLLPARTHTRPLRIHGHTCRGSASTPGHTPPSPDPQPSGGASQGLALAASPAASNRAWPHIPVPVLATAPASLGLT